MEWISVKDKVPEMNVLVLTYGNYEYVVGFLDEDKKWSAKDSDHETGEPWLRDHGAVTHWMPLPKSPKNENL